MSSDMVGLALSGIGGLGLAGMILYGAFTLSPILGICLLFLGMLVTGGLLLDN